MRKMSKIIKARRAKDKKATFGEDLDINNYSLKSKKHEKISSIENIPEKIKKATEDVGFNVKEKERSGSFMQIDHSVVFAGMKKYGLEVMDIKKAIKKHKWLKDYWWKAVDVDKDKYTAEAELHNTSGYFIRAKENTKVNIPVQACLLINSDIRQNVHNVIIAEKNSKLNIITGCAVADFCSALHIGISEFYVKENAKINFTMIHNWKENINVRPRTTAIIDKNGVFLSNYICLRPVKSLQMYPVAICKENSIARFDSIIYGQKNSKIDVGSKAILRGKNSKAEVISRVITKDNADVTARGLLIGENKESKAHLECNGLMLSNKSSIHAIPELVAKAKGTDLSHEAAIGKIADNELFYLMSKGLKEEEAKSLIVRGFLDIGIRGLSANIKKQIDEAVKSLEKGF